MRKLFLLLTVHCLLFTALAVNAQTETTAVQFLGVELWPDYDQPAVLVLLTGTLPPDTSLPAAVTIPLPSSSQLNAVARITADGIMVDDIEFSQQADGVRFITPDLQFRVEYYVPYVSEENGRSVQIANDNCPGQVVISGDEAALNRAMELAQAAKARKVVKLPITIAAHSTLMASAAEAFAQAVDETPIQPPDIPVIANVTAQPLTTPDEIREELKAQLTAGVAWTDSMNYLLGQGMESFVEVGPGDTLLSFMKRINRKAKRVKLTFGDNF